MDAFKEAWGWLGSEIAIFGVRWLVVGAVMIGFSGFIGHRYRKLKAEINELKRDTIVPPVQVVMAPGSTYQDYRNFNGEQHIHFHGEGEIRAPKEITLKPSFGGSMKGELAPELIHKTAQDDD